MELLIFYVFFLVMFDYIDILLTFSSMCFIKLDFFISTLIFKTLMKYIKLCVLAIFLPFICQFMSFMYDNKCKNKLHTMKKKNRMLYKSSIFKKI